MTTELSPEAYEAPELKEVGSVRALTQQNRQPSGGSDGYFWANYVHGHS